MNVLRQHQNHITLCYLALEFTLGHFDLFSYVELLVRSTQV